MSSRIVICCATVITVLKMDCFVPRRRGETGRAETEKSEESLRIALPLTELGLYNRAIIGMNIRRRKDTH